MLCAYPEILSANNRSSFLLFRSADFALASPAPKARMHIAAIPRVEAISAIQPYRGRDENISEGNCITGIFLLGIRYPQNTCHCLLDRKSTRLNSSHLGISYAV